MTCGGESVALDKVGRLDEIVPIVDRAVAVLRRPAAAREQLAEALRLRARLHEHHDRAAEALAYYTESRKVLADLIARTGNPDIVTDLEDESLRCLIGEANALSELPDRNAKTVEGSTIRPCRSLRALGPRMRPRPAPPGPRPGYLDRDEQALADWDEAIPQLRHWKKTDDPWSRRKIALSHSPLDRSAGNPCRLRRNSCATWALEDEAEWRTDLLRLARLCVARSSSPL